MSRSALGFSRYDVGMLVVALIWGGNFSANKYVLVALPPFTFAALRFLLATALLWAFAWSRRPKGPIPPGTWWRLGALGLIGNTGYQAAFMVGLLATTAINSSLIMAALPVVVALLGAALGIERPSLRLWIGILVATMGVALVIANQRVTFSSETLRGDLLVFLAMVCWAVFTVGVRRVGRDLDPIWVTAVTTTAGTPGLLLAAARELPAVAWSNLSALIWVAFAYSALLAIVLAYMLWNYAVQGIGGSRTALYNCLIPLVAAAVAWVVLGERPGPGHAVGAFLVIGGVLLSREPPRPLTT